MKRARAWFEFHNCMNHAGEDEKKLDSVISEVRLINDALTKDAENTLVKG